MRFILIAVLLLLLPVTAYSIPFIFLARLSTLQVVSVSF